MTTLEKGTQFYNARITIQVTYAARSTPILVQVFNKNVQIGSVKYTVTSATSFTVDLLQFIKRSRKLSQIVIDNDSLQFGIVSNDTNVQVDVNNSGTLTLGYYGGASSAPDNTNVGAIVGGVIGGVAGVVIIIAIIVVIIIVLVLLLKKKKLDVKHEEKATKEAQLGFGTSAPSPVWSA